MPARAEPRSSRAMAGVGEVAVEMGTVRVARSEPVADAGLPGSRALPWPAWSVDAGNPHLVLLAPGLGGIALSAIGPALEKRRPGGQNVEFATYEPATGVISLVVWERGAGATLACGSGSVAAAAALHSAGICPPVVSVHNPGRPRRGEPCRRRPACCDSTPRRTCAAVARVEVDPRELGEFSKEMVAS